MASIRNITRTSLSIIFSLIIGVAILSSSPSSAIAQENNTTTSEQTSDGVPKGANPCYDGTSGPLRNCTLSERIADPDGFVYKAWQATRSIINLILILALLVISFSNILRISIDTYTVKKALPNLIIGVILANASFLIIRYMADIATVSVYLFVNLTAYTTFNEFVSGIIALVGLEVLGTIGTLFGLSFILAPIFVIIMGLVVIIGLLWLAFILYFRLVAIYLLTILAPLAFVAYGLPGFEKYFKQWWQQFIKWLFILPAMSAVFWVMYVVATTGDGGKSIAKTIILYFLFFTALSIPSKMGGAVVDKASKAFQKYSGSDLARKYGQERLSDSGKWLGARTPGLYRIQEWNKLRKENFEKDLKIRREKAAGKAASGRAGQRSEDLSLLEEEVKVDHEIDELRRKGIARNKNQIGLKIAQLSDEKKILELGLESQKLDEQRAALTHDEAGKRIVEAELTKQRAEAKKNAATNREKLDFISDSSRDDFLKSVYSDVNEADHLSGAISKQEGITKGGLAQEELVLAKHVDNYKKQQAIYEDTTKSSAERATAKTLMDRIEVDYDNIRSTPGHAFFNSRDINQAAKELKDKKTETAGKVIDAKLSQSKKSVDAGIKGANEDAVRSETFREAEEAVSDLKAEPFFADLAQGNTVGVKVKDQFAFQSYTHKLVSWSRDRNDPRRNEALAALGELHIGSKGPLTISLTGGKGKPPIPKTFSTKAELLTFLSDPSTTDNNRQLILRTIAQDNPYLTGSGGYQTGSVNP